MSGLAGERAGGMAGEGLTAIFQGTRKVMVRDSFARRGGLCDDHLHSVPSLATVASVSRPLKRARVGARLRRVDLGSHPFGEMRRKDGATRRGIVATHVSSAVANETWGYPN
jgi:hypothetical protein